MNNQDEEKLGDEEEKEYSDYIIKLVLLGEPTVGKTSLRRRYMGKGFNSVHMMTLGADFSKKQIILKNNTKIDVQIWDLAGQAQFKSLRPRFLSKSSIAIITFDITERKTFLLLHRWIEELWLANNSTNIPLLIVGNKIDLEESRQVSKSEVVKFMKEITDSKEIPKGYIKFIETSAKTGENVDQAFEGLVSIALKNI